MTSRIRRGLIITPQIIPGGQHALQMYCILWWNSTSARIPVSKLCLRIATHERKALFVDQRERFQLQFVASLCNLPSWRYSLLEITLSFWNAQSVPILVSRPCIGDFWQSWGLSWLDKGTQSDEPQLCWQRLSVCELSKSE